jgi:hypothetical protein
MAVSVQVLMSPGCVHGRQTVELVRGVVGQLAPDARLEIVDVRTMEDAERLGFRGSPTVLVEGEDIEPQPPAGVGLG